MPKGIYKRNRPPWNKDLKGFRAGYKQSEEHKKKIGQANSIALKGKKLPDAVKQKLKKIAIERGFGKWMKGKKLSENTRIKMSESLRGEKSYRWKGGITPINKAIRSSREYRLWREAVFARDNWTCIWCGLKSAKGKKVYLHADHIKPFALFPELRFAIDNGRTLCKGCHEKTDTYGNKLLFKEN